MCAVTKENINFASVLSRGLTEHNMSYASKDLGEDTIFTLPMSTDNAPGINVKLIIDEDGDCKLRSYLAHNIPNGKRPAMYAALNALNAKYRYICFSIDKDGDICASYDFIIQEDAETIFDQVMTMLFLYTDIADKCIPDIMQTLWAKAEPVPAASQLSIKTNLFEEEEDAE